MYPLSLARRIRDGESEPSSPRSPAGGTARSSPPPGEAATTAPKAQSAAESAAAHDKMNSDLAPVMARLSQEHTKAEVNGAAAYLEGSLSLTRRSRGMAQPKRGRANIRAAQKPY